MTRPRVHTAIVAVLVAAAGIATAHPAAQAPTPAARKRLLVLGEEKGYRHDAVSHAMVTIQRLGRTTGSGTPSFGPTRSR